MSPGVVSFLLIFLVLLFTWQAIFTANRDLARAKAWGELGRRALPLAALLVMAASLPLARMGSGDMSIVWIVGCGVLIFAAILLSVSPAERRATRAFKRGDYAEATRLFGDLAREKPLPRNHAFLGAALGASERFDDSVATSTTAIERDPQYGLAYYNRALVLLKMGKKSRAKKDFQQALSADLPRRFRSSIRRQLEELG